MFRITFMTDDKRLPKALRALVGISAGAPEVQPMHNAAIAKNGAVKELLALTADDFFPDLPKEFRTSDVRNALQKMHRSGAPSTVAKLLNEGIKKKLIKRVRGGTYVRTSK